MTRRPAAPTSYAASLAVETPREQIRQQLPEPDQGRRGGAEFAVCSKRLRIRLWSTPTPRRQEGVAPVRGRARREGPRPMLQAPPGKGLAGPWRVPSAGPPRCRRTLRPAGHHAFVP
jgi:hypothetical protein